jgi:hypothetical protein
MGRSPIAGWVGRQVGSFHVQRLLGSGGMGVVFAARDAGGREVALKVMATEIDAELVERFQRECRTLAAIRHPGIVDVIEAGRLPGGEYFYTMELLNDPTLRVLLDRRRPAGPGAFEARDMKAMIGGLLDVLEVLHSHGVVHRDLKPANVFVRPDRSPKLIDFGLIGLVESQLTASGVILGSMTHLSPEQARARKVDGRSDLFQVGLIAYELLTMRPVYTDPLAFFGPRAPGTDPVEYPGGLDDRWTAFIRRALQQDVDRRFQSASEMRAHCGALPDDAWVNRPRVVSRAPSAPAAGKPVHPAGTRRRIIASSVALAGVVLALAPMRGWFVTGVRLADARVIRGIHATAVELLLDRPAPVSLMIEQSGEWLIAGSQPAAGRTMRFVLQGLEPGTVRRVRPTGIEGVHEISVPAPPEALLLELCTRARGDDLEYRWRTAIPVTGVVVARRAGEAASSVSTPRTTVGAGRIAGVGLAPEVLEFRVTSSLGESWETTAALLPGRKPGAWSCHVGGDGARR